MNKPEKITKINTHYCPKLFQEAWTTVNAEFEDPIEKQGYEFGIGSRMKIKIDNGNTAEGVFLGRFIETKSFKTSNFAFYDYEAGKVYLIEESKMKIRFGDEEIPNKKIQPIIESNDQEGESCAAYAITYFLKQLKLNGFVGTGKLGEKLKTSAGAEDLMAIAMNDYYMSKGANFEGVFKKLADDYGLNCHELKYKDPAGFVKAIKSAITKGSPVIIEFNIGPYMITTDHQWVDLNEKFGKDRRLWIPRAVGEKNTGGHAVVAREFFTSPSGREKLLIGDSDWGKRAVIWDIENYILDRKNSSKMQAHVCFEK